MIQIIDIASHILLRSGAIKPLSGDTRLPGPETVNKCPRITSPNFLFVPHPFLLFTTSIFQLSYFVYTLYYLVVWVFLFSASFQIATLEPSCYCYSHSRRPGICGHFLYDPLF